MSNRMIPFGYHYLEGCLEIHPGEAAALHEAFQQYLSGESLLTIANSLSNRHIEYLPGLSDWSKNRVRRLLSEERYLGKDGYPALIAPEVFAAAQELLHARNTQKHTDQHSVITDAVTVITCGECGAVTRRVNDKRYKYQQKYVCTNDACKKEYLINDTQMNEQILELLTGAEIKLPQQSVSSLEIRKKENEIERFLEMPGADAAAIRQLIFDLAAEKYRLLSAGLELTDKLRVALAPANLSSSHIRKTVMETVKQITLMDHESIEITLINDQVLRKERSNGSDSTTANRPRNQADDIAGAAESIA